MKTFILAVPNSNLFPFTIKPINIQSPIHVQLIQQCIADKVPLAVAFQLMDEFRYRPIAGYGMPTISETRLDGSILIYIQGEGKIDLAQATSLPSGVITYHEVEVIHENYELDENLRLHYVALSKYFANWIDRHVIDATQKDFFIQSLVGVKEVIAACGAYLVRDYEMQYELMEMTNINDQIMYLHRLMLSNQLIS